MSRAAYAFSLFVLAALLLGCDGPVAQDGSASAAPTTSSTEKAARDESPVLTGVAVIDLDQVAARLGRDVEIINEVKHRETQLNQELEALRTSYSKQIEERKQELGMRASADQDPQLAALDRDLGAKLQQAQLDAQRELMRHQNSLVTRLREQVKPIARQVAASRGLKMVVAKNEDVVFTFDASLDITNDVVEKLLAQQPSAAPVSDPGPSPATARNPSASPKPPTPRTASQFQPTPATQQR